MNDRAASMADSRRVAEGRDRPQRGGGVEGDDRSKLTPTITTGAWSPTEASKLTLTIMMWYRATWGIFLLRTIPR